MGCGGGSHGFCPDRDAGQTSYWTTRPQLNSDLFRDVPVWTFGPRSVRVARRLACGCRMLFSKGIGISLDFPDNLAPPSVVLEAKANKVDDLFSSEAEA